MESSLTLEKLSEKAIICRRYHINREPLNQGEKEFYLWRCLAIIYQRIKASKSDTPSYCQHCLMVNDNKGANWFSKAKVIKIPQVKGMTWEYGFLPSSSSSTE